MNPKHPFVFYPQRGQNGCGIACLRMLGAPAAPGHTPDEAARAARGLSLGELLEVAGEYGLSGTAFASTYEELRQAAALPCLALLNHRHYVVITGIGTEGIALADPACGPRTLSHGDFIATWYQPDSTEGIWVQFARTPDFIGLATPLEPAGAGGNDITF